MKAVSLAFGAMSLQLAFFPAQGAEEMPGDLRCRSASRLRGVKR